MLENVQLNTSIYVKACAFYRDKKIEEVLSPPRLDYVLSLLPITFFTLFLCFLVYSIFQAYGKVNSYLGHNVMRWPITRIFFDRLAPIQNNQQSIPPITGYVPLWKFIFKLKTYTWVAKVFSYRDEDVEELAGQDGCSSRQLIVAKNRNGPTSDISLLFNPGLTRFETPAKDYPRND